MLLFPLPADCAELVALREYYSRWLAEAAAEQAEVQREMDDLIANAPHGVPLSSHDQEVARAAMDLRAAFEELAHMIERFVLAAEQRITVKQLRGRQNGCVAASRERLASARTHINLTRELVEQSCRLLVSSQTGSVHASALSKCITLEPWFAGTFAYDDPSPSRPRISF